MPGTSTITWLTVTRFYDKAILWKLSFNFFNLVKEKKKKSIAIIPPFHRFYQEQNIEKYIILIRIDARTLFMQLFFNLFPLISLWSLENQRGDIWEKVSKRGVKYLFWNVWKLFFSTVPVWHTYRIYKLKGSFIPSYSSTRRIVQYRTRKYENEIYARELLSLNGFGSRSREMHSLRWIFFRVDASSLHEYSSVDYGDVPFCYLPERHCFVRDLSSSISCDIACIRIKKSRVVFIHSKL